MDLEMAKDYFPKEYKGEVLLQTMFGVRAQNFFSVDIYKVSENEELRQSMGVEGGPFCRIEEEPEIPF